MKEDDIAALQTQNKELQKEVVMLKEALSLTQRQLEQTNSLLKAAEVEMVALRASLLTSRSSSGSSEMNIRGLASPRSASPESVIDPELSMKEKRRSKSVHVTDPFQFAVPHEPGKPRAKTTGTGNQDGISSSSGSFMNLRDSSGLLRESADSLMPSPTKNPKNALNAGSRRQSIKSVFSLGSLGKFRKSMSDLMLDVDNNVDTTTIIGAEKTLNAANLFALLKIRPSYTNLMQRKIIFNFFNDYSSNTDDINTKKSVTNAPAALITPNLHGYRIETASGRTKSDTHWRAKVEIERMEKLENYYAIYFLGKKHSNFIGFVKADIPVIVSVLDEPEVAAKGKHGESGDFLRAILWSAQREYKLFLETSQHFKPNKDGKLKKRDVIKLVFPLVRLTDVKLKRLSTVEIYSDLTAFEQHTKVNNIKAGVLYVKDNQKEEDEIFGNVDPSADFEEFLEMLGDMVTLKGFTGFRGGLDVNNNTTGDKSVYSSWSGIEFMFHVTTLLPYYPLDTQHIERKRHLGNDIVNIVFKEGNIPFNPSVIRSTFTQVFLVVEKIKAAEEGGPTHYKLSVASKNGIPPFGPILRSSFASLDKAKFRDVLLTKVCNAEMAAIDSPVFEEKMTRTRTTLLTNIIKKYKPEESKKSAKKSPLL